MTERPVTGMNEYADFARFYDRLIDVDYDARADYLLALLERHGGRKDTLLDLACGSGSLTLTLARRGIEMIGVDGSEEMLALAREKAERLGGRPAPLFLRQDMRELDLYGTVNSAVCALDSLNHLLRTDDLRQVFARLSLFIEPGGLLIFDVNTPYKHRQVLADNAFVFEEADFLCVWRNRLLARTCEVEMLLDFFVDNGAGYDRLSDMVRERAYTEATLRRLLHEADFETLAVYGDGTTEQPGAEEERWVFVARNCTRNYEKVGNDRWES